MSSASPTRAELREACADVARVLERATTVYLGLLANLDAEDLPERVRASVLLLLRDVAFVRRLAEELAGAADLAEEDCLDDPRLPLDLLARVGDSLLLIVSAETGPAARQEPLAAPEDLERELEGLEAWLALRRG